MIKDSVEKVYCDGEAKLRTETVLGVIRDTHSISESLNIEKMKEYYKKNHFKNAAAK